MIGGTKKKDGAGMGMMMSSIATLRPIKVEEIPPPTKVQEYSGPSAVELTRAADVQRVEEMTERMKERIIKIVVDYAEKVRFSILSLRSY